MRFTRWHKKVDAPFSLQKSVFIVRNLFKKSLGQFDLSRGIQNYKTYSSESRFI